MPYPGSLIFLVSCAQQGATLDQEILAEVDQVPEPLNMAEVQKTIGYPKEARDQKIQGQVVARVLVDQEGNYVEHTWIKEEPQILADAVEKELDQLRFEPAQHQGKSVSFWVSIPFSFRLLDEHSDIETAASAMPKPVNLKEIYEQIRYPKSLKEAGTEGKVLARLKVDSEGRVSEHEILKSDAPEFKAAVEPVLSQLRFEFAEGEEAKATWVTLPFMFKIPAEDR